MVAILLLLAFAPAPKVSLETDPDKILDRFNKDLPSLAKKGKEEVAAARKKVIEKLQKLKTSLETNGKKTEATRVNDRILMAEVLGGEATLGKFKSADLFKKASVSARYSRLLHVMHLPQDKPTYKDFTEYGRYTGTSYYHHQNLSVGCWVYVYPYWFIWGDTVSPAGGVKDKR